MPNENALIENDVIGLIPAAGQATRLAPLPGSKELYPIGLRGEGAAARPSVVSHDLLANMRRAGIRKAFVILREGKWDIPAYYNDGTALLDMHLGYLMMRLPHGPAYTLDQAYPFVGGATIALGFPDILFRPRDAFARLLARLRATQAQVVLGLFPHDRPDTADMVELGPQGQVRSIAIKTPNAALQLAWVIAVWSPAFTQFLHDHLAAQPHVAEPQPEWHVGRVLQAGIEAGLTVQSVTFSDGFFVDMGRPESLSRIYNPAWLQDALD